jgi:hypothetical protein
VEQTGRASLDYYWRQFPLSHVPGSGQKHAPDPPFSAQWFVSWYPLYRVVQVPEQLLPPTQWHPSHCLPTGQPKSPKHSQPSGMHVLPRQ